MRARFQTGQRRIGARLVLLAPNGNERELAVLGPWESRPESGVVSYESELGKQLLGKRVGETLQIGDEIYSLSRIERWTPRPS